MLSFHLARAVYSLFYPFTQSSSQIEGTMSSLVNKNSMSAREGAQVIGFFFSFRRGADMMAKETLASISCIYNRALNCELFLSLFICPVHLVEL